MDFISKPGQWWAFSPWASCLASPHQSRSRSQRVVEWASLLSDTKWDLRRKKQNSHIVRLNLLHRKSTKWSQPIICTFDVSWEIPACEFGSVFLYIDYRIKWMCWAISYFLFFTSQKRQEASVELTQQNKWQRVFNWWSTYFNVVALP